MTPEPPMSILSREARGSSLCSVPPRITLKAWSSPAAFELTDSRPRRPASSLVRRTNRVSTLFNNENAYVSIHHRIPFVLFPMLVMGMVLHAFADDLSGNLQ